MSMRNCYVCKSSSIIALLDFGMQPICNRFLKSNDEHEYMHPLKIGTCNSCGIVQLLTPCPAKRLQPIYEWITYTEPEEHLDEVANTISRLPSININSKICGISFKDDALLERIKKLGFQNVIRLDIQRDIGSDKAYAGVETIQDLLDTNRANAITKLYGKFDIVIARHILEHAYDFNMFIGSLKGLTKPNGYIVFEVPDCTKQLERYDYSMPWEEHILYFTPETFKNSLVLAKFRLERFELYQYPMENCLVAIIMTDHRTQLQFDKPKTKLQKEISKAVHYSNEFQKKRELIRSFLSNQGKITVFGAGHSACVLINILGLKDYIEYIIDDNPHKQGLLMPGSHIPIMNSSRLENEISLCIFTLNPNIEEKIIKKNEEFVRKGGIFLSFCPASIIPLYAHIGEKN